MQTQTQTLEMYPKHWLDQPDEVTAAMVIAKGHDDGIVWEVRFNAGTFYVTQGNLFGSQTIKCDNALLAFAVLNMITSRMKGAKPQPVPKGATLLDPPAGHAPVGDEDDDD